MEIARMIKSNKSLFIKFAISLGVTILLLVAFLSISAFAETAPIVTDTTESVVDGDSSLLDQVIGVDGSKPIEVILFLTLLSLAPSILIMMTSFTRIIIVFSFLRNAMATNATPPNQVLTGLAFFLTIFIMAPVFGEINEVAFQPYTNEEITMDEALKLGTVPLKEFMLNQTSNSDLNFFLELSNTPEPEGGFDVENIKTDLGMQVIIPSFIVSELKRAFQMGFLLFIPFLVIDLVVASTLMSMGMMMLPPAMISLPFKIMLFVLVDGWKLLIGTVIQSYNW